MVGINKMNAKLPHFPWELCIISALQEIAHWVAILGGSGTFWGSTGRSEKNRCHFQKSKH
jgi:hypothetical protein